VLRVQFRATEAGVRESRLNRFALAAVR